MSALIGLVSVEPVETKGKITDPINLKIVFEAYKDLPEEVEFEMALVWDGDRNNDQVLDSIEVGPLKAGKHQFVFDAANAPDYSKVKDEYITDVCALFLHCSYREQRFASVSFYVSNTYTDEELIKEPPEKPILEKLERQISVDDLRVNTFPIKWDDSQPLEGLENGEVVPGNEEEEHNENGVQNGELDLPIAV